jgi:hypothetical protein
MFYLDRFQPAWSIWQSEHPNVSAKLSSFESGELVIECENQLTATQLRHSTQSLLTHFGKYGAKQVSSIKLSVCKGSFNANNAYTRSTNSKSANDFNSPIAAAVSKEQQQNHIELKRLRAILSSRTK